MTLDDCTTAIRAKVGDDSGLAATLRFDCGEAGSIYVDGKALPNTVDNRKADAALLARMPAPAWTFIHGPRSTLSSTQIRKQNGG